jgi:hypothetical protein
MTSKCHPPEQVNTQTVFQDSATKRGISQVLDIQVTPNFPQHFRGEGYQGWHIDRTRNSKLWRDKEGEKDLG